MSVLKRYNGTSWEIVDGGIGESLPIGAEIDFDGTSENIPEGWEEASNIIINGGSSSTTKAYSANYVNNHFQAVGTLLFEDSEGSNTSILLGDSSSNYDYFDIFFKSNDGVYASMRVDEPGGKNISLCMMRPTTGSVLYLKSTEFSIVGNYITAGNSMEASINNAANPSVNKNSNLWITKVVGYKKES